ncbi:hypothetical protein EGW08_018228, partial [Elysia chlorotica]
MAHVQEANSRAASTMRAQILKQRVKVVEEFKVKVKACLKAALTGEVPASCIVALENSVDNLSQQLLATTPSSSSSSSANTPRSGYDLDKPKPKPTSDLGLGEFDLPGDNARNSPLLSATAGFLDEGRDAPRYGKSKHYRISPPQKDTGKFFDAFDAEYDGEVGDGGDFRQRKGRQPARSVSPAVDRGNSHSRRNVESRTAVHFPASHPQLDDVDLFDTSNSQQATPTPSRVRYAAGNRAGSSPTRKSRSDLKPTQAFQEQQQLQRQQQQQSPSNVPSTVSTKGGDTTPVSSNASSPRASPTPTLTRARRQPAGRHGDGDLKLGRVNSPYVTMSRGSGEMEDGDWTTSVQHPARMTGADPKTPQAEFETSPRDQMKRMEARVRLANWAQSGTAPWTSHVRISTRDPFSDQSDPGSGSGSGEEVLLEQRTFPWDQEEDFGEKREEYGGKENGTREVFRVPGPEAEKWVRSQKRTGQKHSRSDSKRELPTNFGSYTDFHKEQGKEYNKDVMDPQERVGILKAVVMAEDQFLSSDESVASNTSHQSFVTLEAEEKTHASGAYKESLDVNKDSVGGREQSRARGMAGSLTSQSAADSGLPRSTRTLNTSNGSAHERAVSPYRKPGKSVVENNNNNDDDDDEKSEDYERIRAAVLR